jgi:hypothetical protein
MHHTVTGAKVKNTTRVCAVELKLILKAGNRTYWLKTYISAKN